MKAARKMWIAPNDSGAVGGCWFDACAEPISGMIAYGRHSEIERLQGLLADAVATLTGPSDQYEGCQEMIDRIRAALPNTTEP